MSLLDTHDRHLLRRVKARWPHLARRVDLALSDSPYARSALRQVAVAATAASADSWSGRDMIRLAKWAEGQ